MDEASGRERLLPTDAFAVEIDLVVASARFHHDFLHEASVEAASYPAYRDDVVNLSHGDGIRVLCSFDP